MAPHSLPRLHAVYPRTGPANQGLPERALLLQWYKATPSLEDLLSAMQKSTGTAEGTQLDREMIRIWKAHSLLPNAVSKSLYKILFKRIGRRNAGTMVFRWKQEK